MIEALCKLVLCHVVVVSGVSRKGCVFFRVAGLLRKKTVYIMHGCAQHEIRLNGLSSTGRGLELEQYLLENADLLLPVSEKFRDWVKTEYPQYANKARFLYNGIDAFVPQDCRSMVKRQGSIAVVGGTRAEKNNAVVADVVRTMPEPVRLEIYGYVKKDVLKPCENIDFMGKVDHDQFLRRLSQVQLFILNALFESFSIATIEALLCGCSVLISEQVGVTGLLELEECDLIHDPMDAEEIRRKIAYLLEHPNNDRILSRLDLDEYSYPKAVERLETICLELSQKR